ncbi:hypothetical protein CJ030_MR1G016591 [Morella rubra]|uniref:Uncharacterized protein n=1 Tax=Morella rubra TaxID=262757 RepID=A0A6A1WIS5_9ROSI|nr:hypothetical protein CJ030_MR1G016591 [Morella rubra]
MREDEATAQLEKVEREEEINMATQWQQLWDCCPPKTQLALLPHLLPTVTALAVFSVTAIFLYKVDDFAFQTKTVTGHNLDPTPWHPFPPKNFANKPSKL